MKTWHIIHVNCDCASGDIARTNKPRGGAGMRCPYCGKIIGFMEFSIEGKERAETEHDAICQHREKVRLRLKEENQQ